MALPRLHLREREVLDAVHRLGRASAADVRAALAEPPSDSAVRTHLRILEDKGLVRHEKEGRRYVYSPAVAPETAGRNALRHLVRTFFADAPERAVVALLGDAASDLSREHLDELDALIQRAREGAE